MDGKDKSGEGLERKDENCRESIILENTYVIMNLILIEIGMLNVFLVSDRNEEHIIINRRKYNPCYKVLKSWAELCSSV